MAISNRANNLSGPDPKRKDPDTRNIAAAANAGATITGSLSGPDNTGTGRQVAGANGTGANLLSPDIKNVAVNAGKDTGDVFNDPRIHFGNNGGAFISPDPNFKINTGSSPVDPRIVRGGEDVFRYPGGLSPSMRTTGDPAYNFYGTISEEALHMYLDKAIEVNNLSHMWWEGAGSDGLEYGPGYDPSNPSTVSALYDTSYNHGKILQMIIDSGAKMAYSLASFRPGTDSYLEWICQTLIYDNDFLHSHDSQMISGACIGETINYLSSTLTKLPSPNVIAKFYLRGRPTTADPLYFDYKLMQIDYTTADDWNFASHLDLTCPETLMYYYYLSTRYIDCGCESIHFGDLFAGCRKDTGNQNLWNLALLIRQYAASINPATGLPHARRGIVLLDTHAGPDPTDSYSYHYLYGWYYDLDPSVLLPDWERQLIFDFNMLGIYYRRNDSKIGICYDIYANFWQTSILPVILKNGYGLINHSIGGLHPQGWYCMHLPVLNRLDNGGIPDSSGCDALPQPDLPWVPDFYGYDNTSWFARQTDDQKNQILIYTYYKIKCLDPYGHIGMPGILPVRYHLATSHWDDNLLAYQHDVDSLWYPCLSQKDTITKIWSGVYSDYAPYGWIHHNFNNENVANADVLPASSLIFVGDDKMYFIGQDGYIHGYIKVNGDYNDGTWLTVSPSYAAQVAAGSQIKAKSDLVASPDGTRLLYIGVDGYIHGFDINDVWTYKYIFSLTDGSVVYTSGSGHYDGFMRDPMFAQSLKAYGSLIYPLTGLICYIGQYIDGSKYIHAFQKSSGSWQTVSPSYAADFGYGQHIAGQYQAGKGLTFDGNANRLYYVGTNGYLVYFEIRSLTDYYYVPCPGNFSLHDQHLVIAGNLAIYGNRIYYVGEFLDNHSYHIHCLVDNGGGIWATVSPSYSADAFNGQPIASQVQSDPAGIIAVSPDGNTIAYFGSAPFPFVFYYSYIDGVNYAYFGTNPDGTKVGDTSLQFTSANDMYYLSSWYDLKVHHLKYGEDYCNNPWIDRYERG